ncbi:hypothetical protein BDR03DRAFT_965595 [Suillus americanus]|nr:hypothetical protein BDR03DRAFT_965595 [Suillus americanus]
MIRRPSGRCMTPKTQSWAVPYSRIPTTVQRHLNFHRSNSKIITYEDNNDRRIAGHNGCFCQELNSLLPDTSYTSYPRVHFTAYTQHRLRT